MVGVAGGSAGSRLTYRQRASALSGQSRPMPVQAFEDQFLTARESTARVLEGGEAA